MDADNDVVPALQVSEELSLNLKGLFMENGFLTRIFYFLGKIIWSHMQKQACIKCTPDA